MTRRGVRAAALSAVVGGAVAGAIAWALFSEAAGVTPRPLAVPTPRDVGGEATALRIGRFALAPASRGTDAALDLEIANVGDQEAVGVGYVLEDEGRVVVYQERLRFPAGAGEIRRLTWRPVGAGPHHLRLVVGDGNVQWVRHEFIAAVRNDGPPPTRVRRGIVAVAAGVGIAAGVAGSLLRRRGERLPS